MPPKGWRKSKGEPTVRTSSRTYKQVKDFDTVVGPDLTEASERLGVNRRTLERQRVVAKDLSQIELGILNRIAEESPNKRQLIASLKNSKTHPSAVLHGMLNEFEKRGYITTHEGLLYITYDGQVELERMESAETPWLSRTWGPRIGRMFEDPGMDY